MLAFHLKLDDLIENFMQQSLLRTRFVVSIANPLDYITSLATISTFNLTIEAVANSAVSVLEVEDLETLKVVTLEMQKIEGIKFQSWGRGILIGSNMHWDEASEKELLAEWKPPVMVDIQRSKHNIPIIGVGGGSYSTKFVGRWVLNSRKQLKRALFIRKSGSLCNTTEMALIPIAANDIIVVAEGNKPFSLDNPDITINVYKVVLIKETQAECLDISDKVDMSFIPDSVLAGTQKYHNKNGEFFCSGLTSTKEKDKADSSDTPVEVEA